MDYPCIVNPLHKAEFSRLHFECLMLEDSDVDMVTMIRLRRRLRAAGVHVLGSGSRGFKRLFEPPLSADPIAVKRHQKVAPAFVFHPQETEYRRYGAGECLRISVLVFGDVIARCRDLIQVFAALGQAGLRLDAGRFKLERVLAVDDGGSELCIWREDKSIPVYAPPVLDLKWWLESRLRVRESADGNMLLSFNTPARLLKGKRPIFSPDFTQLFPFMLRRITSMIYTHCDIELDVDVAALQRDISAVKCLQNSLYWRDWRCLRDAEQGMQPLGGVCGNIVVRDPGGYSPIACLLQLGSLMNLGKNAAYGSGSFSLDFLQT